MVHLLYLIYEYCTAVYSTRDILSNIVGLINIFAFQITSLWI
jgi:hypothetical protein